MWIMTKLGFYSVVCAREGKGELGKPVDTSQVMIRARIRNHLDNLKSKFPDLAEHQIIETSHTDYKWRIVCPKFTWAECLQSLALDIDYPNFKNTCASKPGNDNDYLHALHTTWRAFNKIQR